MKEIVETRREEIVVIYRHDQGKGTVPTAKNGGQAGLRALLELCDLVLGSSLMPRKRSFAISGNWLLSLSRGHA